MIQGDDPTPLPGVPPDLPEDTRASHRPGHPGVTPSDVTRVLPPSSGPDGRRQTDELLRRHAAYVLKRELGRGSFGEVWEAIQVTLDRPVAVKRLRRDGQQHLADPSGYPQIAELMFHREALIAGQLDHPNIVPVYVLGADDEGRPLLAMKLVTGSSWDRVLADDESLTPSERLRKHLPILVQTARAVAFAHDRGVVHRDLKPSQVMLGEYGEVYLMDWGLAVGMADPPQPTDGEPPVRVAIPLAEASNPAGTVAYMAPEQTDPDTARIGPWTDVYLLGGILYNILTGTCPHSQGNSAEAFIHAARGRVEPAEERAPHREIPGELSRLAAWAMEPDPRRRPAHGGEFLEALQSTLTGAGRRDESRQRTAEAMALLQGTTGEQSGYELYEKCDRLLSEALELWEGNDEARQQHRDLLVRYVDEAIDQLDFVLAQAQVERLEPGPDRNSLVARLRRARTDAQAKARIRLIAMVASVVLLLVVVLMSVAFARFVAKNRIEDVQLATRRQQAELEAERQAAELERRRREERRTALVARYRTVVRAVQQDTAPRIPMPFRWEYGEDYSIAVLDIETSLTSEARSQLQELTSIRESLKAMQFPLEPEPAEVLLVRGLIGLYDAGPQGDTAPAYDSFRQAAALAPWRYEPLLGMSTARSRAGQTGAALDLAEEMVQRLDLSYGSTYDVSIMLAQYLALTHWSAYPLGPGDVVVDSAVGGAHQSSLKLTGRWQQSFSYHAERSRARGLTLDQGLDSVLYHFYTPLARANTAGSGTAHFQVPAEARGPRWVYVTWPRQASASRVHYVVVHEDGVATRTLVQDGHGFRGVSTADRWTPLGEFRFGEDPGQGVHVHVGDDAAPLQSQRHGRAYIDAVLYASEALSTGTAKALPAEPGSWPPPASPWDQGTTPPESISWRSDLAEARAESRATGKPLVVYCFFPISSSFVHPMGEGKDYWQNRMWTHPAIRRALSRDFVPVRIDLEKQSAAARELGVPEAAVSVSVWPTGSGEPWRIVAPELLISPVDFLQGLMRSRDSTSGESGP